VKGAACYLVFGPESSCTRMMTRLLIQGGCRGQDTHKQAYDKKPPKAEPGVKVVWRRSFPHLNRWPDIAEMVQMLRVSGYDLGQIRIVVTVRDWWATRESQRKTGHVRDIPAAQRRTTEAYRRIFRGAFETGVQFLVVPVEALHVGGQPAIAAVYRQLGLPAKRAWDAEPVRNENQKHYAGLL